MLQEKMVINDCYILQSQIGEDSNTEHWIGTAIFSAKRFLLRFLKEGLDSADFISALRETAVHSYHVCGPAIADFVELESFQGRFFISSEYNDEGTLLRAIEAGKQWSISQIIGALIALADGLSTFHAIGLVYGNLNSESILVTDRGKLAPIMKIWKPGMLFLLRASGRNGHDAIESFSYLAPEYKKDKRLCAQSDVFSLGIHMVRFLTGRLPYALNADTIRESLPSLRYVSAALFRRGIHEDLVRVALRALMRDTEARYSSCEEMIRDLRSFAASENASVSGYCPAASVYGALPVFESADYFGNAVRQINQGHEAIDPSSLESLLFPLPGDPSGSALENELMILPEEDLWSEEDYIGYGIKTVFGKDYAKHIPAPRATEKKIEPDATVSGETDTQRNVAPLSGKSGSDARFGSGTRTSYDPDDRSALTEIAALTAPTEAIVTTEAAVTSQATVTAEAAVTAEAVAVPAVQEKIAQIISERNLSVSSDIRSSHSWSRHRIRIYDIKMILSRVAKRAGSGHGTFRYIEEPKDIYAGNGLFDLLETLGEDFMYVNAGTCNRYGNADVQDFASMLRKGLSRALEREKPGARRYLATRVRARDTLGVFSAPPLGKILYGESIRLDGPIDFRSADTHAEIAASIRAFGTKRRPLVLVVRGGESITRNLHDFFTLLAGSIDDSPVAVFVFFGKSYVEPWHTLHSLLEKDGNPITPDRI